MNRKPVSVCMLNRIMHLDQHAGHSRIRFLIIPNGYDSSTCIDMAVELIEEMVDRLIRQLIAHLL